MNTAICTLFESRYELGVAALLNSLTAIGFQGLVVAGYKGPEPSLNYAKLPEVGIDLWFEKIVTSNHLTNYKPDFMLQVLEDHHEISHLCYVDPDITICENWKYFEDWLTCGVALCEDVNSPIAERNPRRIGWRKHLASESRIFRYKSDLYVNGGFVGVSRQEIPFLQIWQDISKDMSDVIGGLSVAKIAGGTKFDNKGFGDCFDCSDQDALNASLEVTNCPLSILGRSAMGFESGAAIMPHALGRDKPWDRRFILYALRGIPPRYADKMFFKYVYEPVRVFSPQQTALKRLSIAVASAITRIWKR